MSASSANQQQSSSTEAPDEHQDEHQEEEMQSCFSCRQSFSVEQMQVHVKHCKTVVDDEGNQTQNNTGSRREGVEVRGSRGGRNRR